MKNLLVLLAFLAVAPQRGPELQLNLVGAPPPPEHPDRAAGLGGGCGGGTSDRSPTPFRVTLADTDRLAYDVGDAIVFSVIIENVSTGPLVLGMSRDPDVAPKTMRPCRVIPPGVHFSVALVAVRTTGGGRPLIAFGGTYYGSPQVPGTSMALQPGERVRVQLPAQIRPTPAMESLRTRNPQLVRIKAFVTLDRESLEAAYSDNALVIQLGVR